MSTVNDVYISPYANNIGNMTNREIAMLADNQFTDAETQVAIAEYGYRLGRENLVKNPNLVPEAAKILWNVPGATLKAVLLRDGHIKLSKESLEAAYYRYFKPGRRCCDRVATAFLGTSRDGMWGLRWDHMNWERDTRGIAARSTGEKPLNKSSKVTHAKLLEIIYEEHLTWRDDPDVMMLFIRAKNCSIALAEKINTLADPQAAARHTAYTWQEMQSRAQLLVEKLKARAENARLKFLSREPRLAHFLRRMNK